MLILIIGDEVDSTGFNFGGKHLIFKPSEKAADKKAAFGATSQAYGSYVSVDVYCGTTTVISSTLFWSTTSTDSTSLDSYYYTGCASRLSNNIDEVLNI